MPALWVTSVSLRESKSRPSDNPTASCERQQLQKVRAPTVAASTHGRAGLLSCQTVSITLGISQKLQAKDTDQNDLALDVGNFKRLDAP